MNTKEKINTSNTLNSAEIKQCSNNLKHLQHWFYIGLLIKNGLRVELSKPKKRSSSTFPLYPIKRIFLESIQGTTTYQQNFYPHDQTPNCCIVTNCGNTGYNPNSNDSRSSLSKKKQQFIENNQIEDGEELKKQKQYSKKDQLVEVVNFMIEYFSQNGYEMTSRKVKEAVKTKQMINVVKMSRKQKDGTVEEYEALDIVRIGRMIMQFVRHYSENKQQVCDLTYKEVQIIFDVWTKQKTIQMEKEKFNKTKKQTKRKCKKRTEVEDEYLLTSNEEENNFIEYLMCEVYEAIKNNPQIEIKNENSQLSQNHPFSQKSNNCIHSNESYSNKMNYNRMEMKQQIPSIAEMNNYQYQNNQLHLMNKENTSAFHPTNQNNSNNYNTYNNYTFMNNYNYENNDENKYYYDQQYQQNYYQQTSNNGLDEFQIVSILKQLENIDNDSLNKTLKQHPELQSSMEKIMGVKNSLNGNNVKSDSKMNEETNVENDLPPATVPHPIIPFLNQNNQLNYLQQMQQMNNQNIVNDYNNVNKLNNSNNANEVKESDKTNEMEQNVVNEQFVDMNNFMNNYNYYHNLNMNNTNQNVMNNLKEEKSIKSENRNNQQKGITLPQIENNNFEFQNTNIPHYDDNEYNNDGFINNWN